MDLSNITINKQSSIRIAGGKVLYFDAFQVCDENHDADYVFVTHEHFDHFDPASIAGVMNETSVFIAPESMKKKFLKELSVDESRCIFCQPGDKLELEGICIKTVPAYNKLKPFHMKSSKWLGYQVKMDDVVYYVMGDTDANEDVKAVSCDVALVPVGGHYTMDKKQAAELICGMKPVAAIPTHYGEVVGDPMDGQIFSELVNASDKDIQVELRL